MERRFVIKEVTNSMLSYEDSLQQVSESELRWRIDSIQTLCRRDYERREAATYQKIIDILLKGTSDETKNE